MDIGYGKAKDFGKGNEETTTFAGSASACSSAICFARLLSHPAKSAFLTKYRTYSNFYCSMSRGGIDDPCSVVLLWVNRTDDSIAPL